ncbi:MAG: hypothetical protein WCS62_06510 [Bacilli bacterium]
MSKRDFASLVFKLLGVCMLARNLAFLPMLLNACWAVQVQAETPMPWRLLAFATPVLGLLTGIFMIAGSEWIAARLIRNDGEFTPGFKLVRQEVLHVAFCCIGLLTLVDVLPKLFNLTVFFLLLSRISGSRLLQPQYGLESLVSDCGEYFIQTLIGMALFLQPQRLAEFCRKRRDNIKKESAAEP